MPEHPVRNCPRCTNPTPVPLMEGAQAPIDAITPTNEVFRIAYMPPATEFNYYIAIGEGIKAVAAEAGVEVFMLAPQSGADINGMSSTRRR